MTPRRSAAHLLALLVVAWPSSAAAGDPRVTAVEVSGAARTSRGTVLLLARVREGDPWRDGLDAELRQNLLNAQLFYEVTVAGERTGDAVTVRIALREKWSLIPIPLVIAREGRTMYGLTVIESNLFGRAKKLFAIAAVEDGNPGGTIVYIDPALGGTDFQVFALLTRTERVEPAWDATQETGTYRRRSAGGSLALGRRLTPRTSLSAGVRVADERYRDPRDEASPPADARLRAISLRLRRDGFDADEERRRGDGFEISLDRGFAFLGDEVGTTTLRGEGRLAFSPAGRHTLLFAGHGFATGAPAYAEDRVTAFLRGYERGRFRPDRLAGVSADYQVPVSRRRQATVSIIGFADAALLRDAHRRMAADDLLADVGVGVGVYLRRVAVPVLQLTAAYGFSNRRILPGFSLGFAF